ncbi:hypothetical protein IJ670_06235 [bacterium]|nr:hypothetical protein [bacterium]
MFKKILLSLFCLLCSFSFALDFNYGGRNLTYNPDELKFYENNKELNSSELQTIFPDYEIVLISKFDSKRKYKVKKSFFKPKKILLLNDTKRTFHRFYIYPETSRYENPEIKSLIKIYGKKNVHLKHEGGDKFEINVK